MISATSTLVDIAYAVSTALSEAGVTAVLTGGSAATYYAPHAYQSADLDFVITMRGKGNGAQALLDLGYEETRGSIGIQPRRFRSSSPKGRVSTSP